MGTNPTEDIAPNYWYDTRQAGDTQILDFGNWSKEKLLLEVATLDGNSQVTGTALFEVTSPFPADGYGKFVEVVSRRASLAGLPMEFSRVFPLVTFDGAPRGVLHLCRTDPIQCMAHPGYRRVLHAAQFRVREPQYVKEPWACLEPPVGGKASDVKDGSVPSGGTGGAGGSSGFDEAKVSEFKAKLKELKRKHLESRLDDPHLSASEKVIIRGILSDSEMKKERKEKKIRRRKRSSSSGRGSRESESDDDGFFRVASTREGHTDHFKRWRRAVRASSTTRQSRRWPTPWVLVEGR